VSHFSLSKNRLALLTALWMTTTANDAFWKLLWNTQSHGAQLWLFTASLFAAITSVTFAVQRLLGPGRLLKPVISILLLIAAVVSWFMDTYGVAIDADMLRNALQTDWHEARDFVGFSLLWRISWQAVLPILFVWRVHLLPETRWRALRNYVLFSTAGFVSVFIFGMPMYKYYASFFRNHLQARSLIAPDNFIDASVIYTNRLLRARQPFVQVGLDAKQQDDGVAKPLLTVVVVGETARAANFSLGGYARNTNPQLAQRGVLYFSNVHSCGTATAISVPCMFSDLPRDEFDVSRSERRDNVLDVLQRGGVQVNWVDNQAGCKNVCRRVPSEQAASYNHVRCDDETCKDELLFKVMDARLASTKQDTVLLLHQMGSHGPAYFRRTSPELSRFQPSCMTERIETCSAEQIVNAYDNSILYTDYVLAGLIDRLQKASDRVDSVLVYVSDHGESLGENGLYLHGETYLIAPDYQKHVPMLMWFSADAPARLHVDTTCLRGKVSEAYSHDNLAHTLLGIAGVKTQVYRPSLDLLAPCRPAS
jgi:lipid A ethanolaminephosphotransferase